MADVIREQRLPFGAHRADEIRVHHLGFWQSSGPLLALLGVLGLGLLALWAYQCSRAARIPEVERTITPPTLPDMPKMPELPKLEPPPLIAPPPPEVETPPVEEPEAQPGTVKPVAPPAPAPEAEAAPDGIIEEKDIYEIPGGRVERLRVRKIGESGTVKEIDAGAFVPTCAPLDVYFMPDAARLTEDDLHRLDQLATCLKQNPNVRLRLQGRTDGREPGPRYGLIARQRADAVAAELTARGVSPSRIETVVEPSRCIETDEACMQRDRSVSASTE
jgi:outer membrane protein OmpA-like peptidoglycan-associated protein